MFEGLVALLNKALLRGQKILGVLAPERKVTEVNELGRGVFLLVVVVVVCSVGCILCHVDYNVFSIAVGRSAECVVALLTFDPFTAADQ